MRLIHEHQCLGKGCPGFHDFNNLFLTFGGNPEKLDSAREHQVKIGRVIALEKQGLAFEHVGNMRMATHAIQLGFGQLRKQV